MKTVYVVIKRGCVIEAFADEDTDLVVLDFDTQDDEMLEEIQKTYDKLQANSKEIEIY